MQYHVHGPFRIHRDGRLVDRSPTTKAIFWSSVEEQVEGLSGAVGCYVFCIGNKPWYVGLAEKQTFRGECFQPHKINAFNSALNKMQGKPYIVFLSKMTNTGRYARPGVNGHKDAQFLEDMLIGMALAHNPLLENISGTKFMKKLSVPGIINTPQGRARKKSVQYLKRALLAK